MDEHLEQQKFKFLNSFTQVNIKNLNMLYALL